MKKLVTGFAFNQKHFHSHDCVTTVVLWENSVSQKLECELSVWDIIDNKCMQLFDDNDNPITIKIRKCTKAIGDLGNTYDKSVGIETTVVCGSDGYEINGYQYKTGRRPVWDNNIIAYCRTTNLKLNAMNYALVRCNLRTGLEQCYGRHIMRNGYLQQLPLFVAKLFPEDKWYEKDVYSTTADGGDVYTKDADFLKSCLLYTCIM